MVGKCLIIMTWLIVALPCVSGAGARAAAAGSDQPPATLVLLNWAEYIQPELVAEFESRYQVRVKEVYYETEASLDQVVAATKGQGYDLLIASRTKLLSYIRRGWGAPLDRRLVPNLRHIDPFWLEKNPRLTGYAVPYLWGTVGIAYRRDLVREKITGWRQLFRPAERLRGKIMMIEDVRDTVGMALKALGYSLNSRDPKQLAEAEALLLAQRPYVRKYGYLSVGKHSALLNGTYWMAMLYSGDALTLADQDSRVAYVTPREGTNIWLDSIMVLAGSRKKKLAFQFINFLTEPAHAARLAEYLSMASPNRAARALLPREHLENPDIYPPAEVVEKSEFYQPLPPRVLKRYNEIFVNASHGLL